MARNEIIHFNSKPIYAINRKYLNKDGDQFAMSIQMTNSSLLYLKNEKEKSPNRSLIDIFNTRSQYIHLKQVPRVETRLNCQCSNVFNKLKTTYSKGRKRYAFLKQIYTLTLYKSELRDFTVMPRDSTAELNPTNLDTDRVCEEVRCYVDSDRIKDPQPPDFDSLHPQTKKKRLETIIEHSKEVLNFLEEYGLKPQLMTVSSHSKQRYQIKIGSEYASLTEENKTKLRTVVSILDRFGVSESAYHELSQLFKDLPRTHSVVKTRTKMSSSLNIQRVAKGAMVSFKEQLQNQIRRALQISPALEDVTVLLSGDGTKVSRILSLVIFSFQLIGIKNKHPPYLCTLAVVNCREKYIDLKKSLSKLFDEVNEVIEEGMISVEEKRIGVRVTFCADMKMILTVLGFKAATSAFSCPWCFVSKEDRHRVQHPKTYYTEGDMKRTLAKVKVHADSQEYGVQHKPLLNIPLDNYMLDELHLLLRITDVLLNHLVKKCQTMDKVLISNNKPPVHIEMLRVCMKECGVSFHVWEDKESKQLKWTVLTGQDKKKLLEHLPSKLKGNLNPDTEDKTLQLWQTFRTFHQAVSSATPQDPEVIFLMAKTWVETYLSFDLSFKKNVTPYMHCMVYHIPWMLSKLGSLRLFSCQSVEKTNDDIKKIYQRKANKWDPMVEILTIRKRMENSTELVREKRPYKKRNKIYWETGIKDARQEKRAKIQNESQALGCVPVL